MLDLIGLLWGVKRKKWLFGLIREPDSLYGRRIAKRIAK